MHHTPTMTDDFILNEHQLNILRLTYFSDKIKNVGSSRTTHDETMYKRKDVIEKYNKVINLTQCIRRYTNYAAF